MPQGFTKLQKFIGVNFTDPVTDIADNELAWARNCFGDERGYIGPRAQQLNVDSSRLTNLHQLVLDEALNDIGLYQWVDAELKHRMLYWLPFRGNGSSLTGPVDEPVGMFLQTSTAIAGVSDTPIVERPDSLTSVFKLAGAPSRPTSLVYNNEIFLFLGHTFPGLILGAADMRRGTGGIPKFRELGTTWVDFDSGGSPALEGSGDKLKFAFGDVYRDIFVLGGLPPPYESLLFFTQGVNTAGVAQLAYYTLLSTAKTLGIGFGDGDKLLRVITTPILGGAAAVEPYAIALKHRSVWLMQGSPPTLTSTGTLVVTPVMRREGLVAPHAVCVTPYGIAWCSGRNVWLMPPGQQPVPIGDKIKGFIEKLPQQPASAWFMEFHDDVLYLNFPSPSGMVAGYSTELGPSKYLPSQQLWCDMRKPDEPRWWGPQDVRAAHQISVQLPDGPRQLQGATPFWVSNADQINIGNLFRVGTTVFAVPAGSAPTFAVGDTFELSPGEANFPAGTKRVTIAGSPFSYEEAGAAVTSTILQTFTYDTFYLQPNGLAETATNGRDLNDSGETNPVDGQLVGNTSTFQSVRFREMDFGDDTLLKIIEALEINGKWDLALGSGAADDVATDAPVSMRWLGDGGRQASSLQPAGTPTALYTATEPSTGGFTLDHSTLSGGDKDANLSETFIPIVFFPGNGTRFLCRSLQPEVNGYYTHDQVPDSSANYFTRHITIKSVTVRARPIGRRPGGSYGG